MSIKRKKSNIWISILIIITGISIISAFIAYMFFVNSGNVEYFNRNQRAAGQMLYDEIFSFNLSDDYPETPEEIMQLYSAISFFIYGGSIYNEELYRRALEQQRGIFSNSLINDISIEDQLSNLHYALDVLSEVGAFPRRPQTVHIRREGENRAFAYVRQFIMYYDHVYWIYFLEKDENERWKIQSWVRTDNTFTTAVD